MRKYNMVVITVLLIIAMGVYKPVLLVLMPNIDKVTLAVLQKSIQLITMFLYIFGLKINREIISMGNFVLNLKNKKVILYLIPVIVFSFIPLISGIASMNFWNMLMTLLLAILIGILEELQYRGVIFSYLNKVSRKQAIIGSSIIFGLMHFLNMFYGAGLEDTLMQVFLAFGFGLIMATYRSYANNLTFIMLAHALWDFNFDISYKPMNELADVLNTTSIALLFVYGVIIAIAACKKYVEPIV